MLFKMGAKQNIIFLDEHGVVVSRNSMIINAYMPKNIRKNHEEMVNPYAVSMINDLAQRLNASFVSVSSVRRDYRGRDDYARHLSRMGFDADRLHTHYWSICGDRDLVQKRHLRIQKFLDEHENWIDQYLIIDDIADLKNHFKNAVCPNSRLGFTIDDHKKSLALFGLQPPQNHARIFKPQ